MRSPRSMLPLAVMLLLVTGCAASKGAAASASTDYPPREPIGCAEAGRRGLPAPRDTVGCSVARWYGANVKTCSGPSCPSTDFTPILWPDKHGRWR